MPQHHPPGLEAEVDFGELLVRLDGVMGQVLPTGPGQVKGVYYGTATGDSELIPVALPPAFVPM
jgi:hypothetical protein